MSALAIMGIIGLVLFIILMIIILIAAGGIGDFFELIFELIGEVLSGL